MTMYSYMHGSFHLNSTTLKSPHLIIILFVGHFADFAECPIVSAYIYIWFLSYIRANAGTLGKVLCLAPIITLLFIFQTSYWSVGLGLGLF